jgi:taurine--2-oxoglutarate transaminase
VDLAEKHESISEVRGTGLHQAVELVKNRESREPMSGWNRPASEPMRKVTAKLRELGRSAFVKWDWIFCTPPLIITEEQIGEGLDLIDQALAFADQYYENESTVD